MPLLLTLFNEINLSLPNRGFFTLRRVWQRAAGLSVGQRVRIANVSASRSSTPGTKHNQSVKAPRRRRAGDVRIHASLEIGI